MTRLHKTTLGVAHIAYLCLSSTAFAGALPNGTYSDTDFGTIEWNCSATGFWECAASYEGGESFLFVDRNGLEGQYTGYWAEPESDNPCDTEMDFDVISTKAWGTIELQFDAAGDAWSGTWGYCNDAQTLRFDGARGAEPLEDLVLTGVTPQSVWDSLHALVAADPDMTITYTQSMSDDTLTIRDYTIHSATPDGGATVMVPEITLRQTDGNTVLVTISEDYSVHLTSVNNMGKAVNIAMLIQQPGLTLVVFGDEADRTYHLSAPSNRITIADKTVDGISDDVVLDVALRGLDGVFKIRGSGIQTVSSDLSVDSVTIDIKADGPQGGGATEVHASLSDLKSGFQSNLDERFYTMPMADSLAAGFTVGGQFSHGAMAFDISSMDESEGFASNGAIASGNLNLSLSGDAMTYSGSTSGLEFAVSGAAIPLPLISIALGEAGFNVLMPVIPTETAKDFWLQVRLIGLTASDDIWNTFDPTFLLPRDPATVVLDLIGKANWLVNIFDPEVTAALSDPASGQIAGEVQSLTLKEMTLRFAGADLTGDGDFIFDNTDLTSFDGLPKPTGAIGLKLIGGNGLLENLLAIGLLPEEAATSVRMALGLFARLVEGTEDTLTSQIEFKEDGSVMANGQRLR
jgi:hypothetical protein